MRRATFGIGFVLGLCFLPDSLLAQMGGGGGCGGGGGGGGVGMSSAARRVSTEYDDARNATIISVGPVGRSDAAMIHAAFQCSGKSACIPDAVQLAIIGPGWAQGPALEQPRTLAFALDDGTTVEAANARGQTQKMRDGGTAEIVIATVPIEEFLKIAVADEVEVRFGPSIATLSKQQRNALRDVAKRIEKATRAM